MNPRCSSLGVFSFHLQLTAFFAFLQTSEIVFHLLFNDLSHVCECVYLLVDDNPTSSMNSSVFHLSCMRPNCDIQFLYTSIACRSYKPNEFHLHFTLQYVFVYAPEKGTFMYLLRIISMPFNLSIHIGCSTYFACLSILSFV